MFRLIAFAVLLFSCHSLQAQNLVDEEGLKTGHWKVMYPKGQIRYEADFVKGQPVGEMLRYYENGVLQARMVFEPGSSRSYTSLFYSSSKPAAEGWYVDQRKDSVWTYYSEFDGSIRIRETYLEGKLHGLSNKYYPDGKISEKVEWKDNVEDGIWKQYYKNDVLRLSGSYKNGLLQGSYEVYSSESTIMIRGNYLDNKSHGMWLYYNEKGEEVYALEYVNGAPADREKYDLMIGDSLKKFEAVTEPGFLQ